MSLALRATAVGAALLFLAGCGGGDRTHGAGHEQKKVSPDTKEFAKPGKPAPLTKIADAIGCKATIVTEAEELRQGSCGSGQKRFTMVTFATDKGQHDWLTTSKDYGGMYLVGKRWSVTGLSMGSLEPLREKIGGSLEKGMSMSHGGSHGGTKTGDGMDGMDRMDGMDGMDGSASHAGHDGKK
ncbi:hypothetical protein [Streptomyces iranensis]|uniref:Lipoprotein n=1 Tax=Streptomyces iranensis TaxID=576784 RepID=A0A060ZNJ7_9ACTN|nr:hypothetical protein [Streptomyces iranensis]MBP2062580.1 hypothetical protein [Streptomyces iranensis]CDR04289.1 lipoprotein [Streptomyces iranensis]